MDLRLLLCRQYVSVLLLHLIKLSLDVDFCVLLVQLL